MGSRCPVCGEFFPLWLDEPLTGCVNGGQQLCQRALDRAYADGMRRKICPEAFDANGNVILGETGRLAFAMWDAGLCAVTGRPLKKNPAPVGRLDGDG